MNRTRSQRPLAALPLLFVLSIAAHALLAGCGQKSDSGGGEASSTTAAPATPAPPDVSTPDTAASGTPVAAPGSIDGAKIFAVNCALCHGPSGHGDGPGSKGLKPAPRNFHDDAYMKTRTDEQLTQVIKNGKGVMPAWGKKFNDAQIAAVLAHVRTFAGTP